MQQVVAVNMEEKLGKEMMSDTKDSEPDDPLSGPPGSCRSKIVR